MEGLLTAHIRRLIRQTFDRVIRNQVDFALDIPEQSSQPPCVFEPVVDACQQDILECDDPISCLHIPTARIHQNVQRIPLVDRHNR